MLLIVTIIILYFPPDCNPVPPVSYALRFPLPRPCNTSCAMDLRRSDRAMFLALTKTRMAWDELFHGVSHCNSTQIDTVTVRYWVVWRYFFEMGVLNFDDSRNAPKKPQFFNVFLCSWVIADIPFCLAILFAQVCIFCRLCLLLTFYVFFWVKVRALT